MFVRTFHVAAPGTTCQVHMALPGSGELTLDCNVIRTRDLDSGSDGLGLCFDEHQLSIETDKMQRLGQLLVDIRAFASALETLEVGQNVRGNFAKTPLASVLSCVAADGTSGSLRTERESARGPIALRDGQVLALDGDEPGDYADQQDLHVLLDCGASDFVFEKCLPSAASAKQIPIDNLLWKHLQWVHPQSLG